MCSPSIDSDYIGRLLILGLSADRMKVAHVEDTDAPADLSLCVRINYFVGFCHGVLQIHGV